MDTKNAHKEKDDKDDLFQMSGSYGEMADYGHQDQLIDEDDGSQEQESPEDNPNESYNSFVEQVQVEHSQRSQIPVPGLENERLKEHKRNPQDDDGSASGDGEDEGAFEHTQSGIVDDKNFDEEATDEAEPKHTNSGDRIQAREEDSGLDELEEDELGGLEDIEIEDDIGEEEGKLYNKFMVKGAQDTGDQKKNALPPRLPPQNQSVNTKSVGNTDPYNLEGENYDDFDEDNNKDILDIDDDDLGFANDPDFDDFDDDFMDDIDDL